MNKKLDEITSFEQAEIKKIIANHKNTKGALIPILHEVQELYGYLPFQVQRLIAEEAKIPLAEIYGVATFYAQFNLKPRGRYRINVCMGTACYVKGSGAILDKFQGILNIEVGDCTEDQKFSLEACRCIGACGLAPVITINEDVYGRLVPEDVPGILEKYK